MIFGFLVVAILSGLPNKIAGIFGGEVLHPARLVAGDGISVVDLCFGTLVTFRSRRSGCLPRPRGPRQHFLLSSPA